MPAPDQQPRSNKPEENVVDAALSLPSRSGQVFTDAAIAATVFFLLHQIPVKTSLFLVEGIVERDAGTQVDHVPDDRSLVAPTLSWQPNDRTTLTLQARWQRDRSGSTLQFLPWSGSLTENPNGEIPTETFLGEPIPEPWTPIDWDADPEWEFRTALDDDPAYLLGLYDAACARARDIVAGAVSLDALSVGVSRRDETLGQPFSLRWIVLHMIEETARHLGHADLIRQAIDGATDL